MHRSFLLQKEQWSSSISAAFPQTRVISLLPNLLLLAMEEIVTFIPVLFYVRGLLQKKNEDLLKTKLFKIANARKIRKKKNIMKKNIVNFQLIDSDGTRRMSSTILPWS